MAASAPKIRVHKDGVFIASAALSNLGVKDGDFLSIVQSTRNLLTLAHTNGKAAQAPSFFGDIASFGIPDIFSLLNMTQKSGRLVFYGPDFTKYAIFRRGEIVFAGSTLKEERLGNILYKTGMLTREQWEAAEARITPDKRFGSVLVEQKLLTTKDLWEGVRYQIEEIVYSLFTQPVGHFAFFEGETADEDLIGVTFNTQHLMMEGFQRLDEFKLISERIPDRRTVFRIAAARPSLPLEDVDHRVIECIDGRADVDEIVRRSRLGEFNTYKVLFKLLKMGFLETGAASAPSGAAKAAEPVQTESAAEAKFRKIIGKYNHLYAQLLIEARKLKADFKLIEQANGFFMDLPEKYIELYDELHMEADGRLREDRLLENLKHINISGGGNMLRIAGLKDLLIENRLLDGLNELLNFLLFSAKNLLPADQADRIAKDIRDQQKKPI